MSLFGPNVEKLKANKDIDGLLGVIRRDNSGAKEIRTRDDAVSALCSIGIPAIPAIRSLYDDDTLDHSVRSQLFVSMAVIPSTEIVDMLIGALDKYPYARRNICRSLGEIGDVKAVVPLIEVLQKTRLDFEVSAVIKAMEQLNDVRTVPTLLTLAGWESRKMNISSDALMVAKNISPDIDGNKLNLLSVWKRSRPDMYILYEHNVEPASPCGVSWQKEHFCIKQTYEHKGFNTGCQACEMLIQEHIDSELKDNHCTLGRRVSIGYELGNGHGITYSKDPYELR